MSWELGVSRHFTKMKRNILILTMFIILTTLTGCRKNLPNNTEEILKIEMNLSAFGVESDNFPSIDAEIDYSKNKSECVKSYYNPVIEGSTYSLSKTDMEDILTLLNNSNLHKLEPKYKVTRTDQPSSKTVIYTSKTKYEIIDYGLEGDYPLQELYERLMEEDL